MNNSNCIAIIFSVLIFNFTPSSAHAACTVDRSGTVYCSSYPNGGAELSLNGTVVCGKGECARNRFGLFECSTKVGGGVARDSRGIVRCLDGCEDASETLCELGK